jgi:alkylated DNA repair dioxygenase AlkB
VTIGRWHLDGAILYPVCEMSRQQIELFASTPAPWPQGLHYSPDLLTEAEERTLLSAITLLPFKEFEFRGFHGKRRVVSFGWRYDFNGGGLQRSADIPGFLLPVRERVAAYAGVAASDLGQASVIEYPPGAGIGWHRDRPVFGDVIGLSLLSQAQFRLRRKVEGGWERTTISAQPRSIYRLAGASRTEWEHSIPAVAHLRYSITFRQFKSQ